MGWSYGMIIGTMSVTKSSFVGLLRLTQPTKHYFCGSINRMYKIINHLDWWAQPTLRLVK
jgi:hypothetical protein